MSHTEVANRKEVGEWMPLTDEEIAARPKPPTKEQYREIMERVNRRNNPGLVLNNNHNSGTALNNNQNPGSSLNNNQWEPSHN